MPTTKFISFASAKKIAKGLKQWASGQFATPAQLPTSLTDLTNDGNFVTDANYVHTDNNYTTAEKTKLAGIDDGADVNVLEGVTVNGTDATIANKKAAISVPTTVAELSDSSDYATVASLGTAAAADTETTVGNDSGLPTGAAVKTFVEGKGYQTASDVSTAVEAYGYQTASDVSTAIGAAVASVYKVKGSVATYEDLPSTGRTTGDVYNVVAAHGTVPAGTNYVFNGSTWDELGGSIDLSPYMLAADLVDVTDSEIAEIVAAV